MTDKTITVIAAADDGIRLDRWFKRHRADISHALLEKHLRKGTVRLDGKKAKASDRIAAGQSVSIPPIEKMESIVPKKRPKLSEEETRDLQSLVLYRDDKVIAFNKPAGLAVQGGTGLGGNNLDDKLDALRFDLRERPRLVHRLDKDTSGVLLLARTPQAAKVLTERFAGKDVRKIYWALVVGRLEVEQGMIDLPLLKEERGQHSKIVEEKVGVDPERGKRAVTYYRVVESLGHTLSWVEMWPVTGRTHQLRVHMAAIGHPIVGDGKYGGKDAFVEGSMDLPRQMHLHARRIQMTLANGKSLDVTAPLGSHMKQSWKLLNLSEKAPGPDITELYDRR